jgi:CBS domain-containing protein
MGAAPRLLALAGTAIHAHPSWLAIWALLTLTLGAGALTATGVLLAAVALHAFAQTLAARAAGLRVRRVTLYPFGGVTELEGGWRSARDQMLGAVVGPATVLALAALAVAASFALGPASPRLLYIRLASAGLAVAAVNVLPADPLDGGRLLEAVAWWHTGRPVPGAARMAGAAVRGLLLLAAVVTIARGDTLGGVWLVLLALLLRGAAQASAVELALRAALLPLKVREAMTRSVVAVPPDASVAELVETFWAYHFTSYPVIADGMVLGLVNLRDVATVDRERWPRTRIRALMLPLSDELRVAPGDSLLDALAKASRNGIGRLAVMEGRHLSGYLSSLDITEALARRGLSVSRRHPARAASRSPRP